MEEDRLMINMTIVLSSAHQQALGSYTLGPLRNSTSISGHHQMMFQPEHIHACNCQISSSSSSIMSQALIGMFQPHLRGF